jgi:hypothetical protein
MPRFRTFTPSIAVALGLAAPALAAGEVSTRAVDCRAGNCLQVSGRRDSAAAAVLINGHAVAVEGGRSWRAEVLEPVRRFFERAGIDLD